jgi:sporulation-control protein spo0M
MMWTMALVLTIITASLPLFLSKIKYGDEVQKYYQKRIAVLASWEYVKKQIEEEKTREGTVMVNGITVHYFIDEGEQNVYVTLTVDQQLPIIISYNLENRRIERWIES